MLIFLKYFPTVLKTRDVLKIHPKLSPLGLGKINFDKNFKIFFTPKNNIIKSRINYLTR
jgi:hypothetical protein